MKQQQIDFIKFSIVSIVTTIIDLAIFQLICNNSKRLLIIAIATFISRTVSTILCYIFNKHWVFKSKKQDKSEFIKFVILVACQIAVSAFVVWLFKFLPIPQIVIKIIADTILFFIGYFIQKKFIFKKKEA